jgi:hypothetical protein
MKADSAKKETAEKLRETASGTCQAWNYKMMGFGGPAQPSPTIADVRPLNAAANRHVG